MTSPMDRLRSIEPTPRGERLARYVEQHGDSFPPLHTYRRWAQVLHSYSPSLTACVEPDEVRAYAQHLRRAREERAAVRRDLRTVERQVQSLRAACDELHGYNARMARALDEACRIIVIISPYGGPGEAERIREIACGKIGVYVP